MSKRGLALTDRTHQGRSAEDELSSLKKRKLDGAKRTARAAGQPSSFVLSRSRRCKATVPLPYLVQQVFFGPPVRRMLRRTLRLIHQSPNVYLVENFLTASEIRHLGAIVDGQHKRFKTSFTEEDYGKELPRSVERTSETLFLGQGQDSTIRCIERRASEFAGMPVENIEPLQIVSYQRGQHFDVHHDMGTLTEEGSVEAVSPRRLMTLFIYLNTLPEGIGHTEFPNLQDKQTGRSLSVKPIRGHALFFSNVDKQGNPDSSVAHRGCPVSGQHRKFGINIWITDSNLHRLGLSCSGINVKPRKTAACDSGGGRVLQRQHVPLIDRYNVADE